MAKIHIQDIGIYAARIIGLVRQTGVESLLDLKKIVGKPFPVPDQNSHLIQLRRMSYGFGSFELAYATSEHNVDNPVIKALISTGYDEPSDIILKADRLYHGYSPMASDSHGNVLQERIFACAGQLSRFIGELEGLALNPKHI